MIQFDLEWTLEAPSRGHVRRIAFVADADVLVRAAIDRQFRMRPGELGAEDAAIALARTIYFLLRLLRHRTAECGEAHPASGGLHRLVFLFRYLDVNRPEPGHSKQ